MVDKTVFGERHPTTCYSPAGALPSSLHRGCLFLSCGGNGHSLSMFGSFVIKAAQGKVCSITRAFTSVTTGLVKMCHF